MSSTLTSKIRSLPPSFWSVSVREMASPVNSDASSERRRHRDVGRHEADPAERHERHWLIGSLLASRSVPAYDCAAVGWNVTVSSMVVRGGMVVEDTLGVNSGRSQVIEEITSGAAAPIPHLDHERAARSDEERAERQAVGRSRVTQHHRVAIRRAARGDVRRVLHLDVDDAVAGQRIQRRRGERDILVDATADREGASERDPGSVLPR